MSKLDVGKEVLHVWNISIRNSFIVEGMTISAGSSDAVRSVYVEEVLGVVKTRLGGGMAVALVASMS